MKATDFNLQQDLKFDPDSGLTTFRNSRLVILDANALGLLRATLVKDMGIERARTMFLRFGYANGFEDFNQMRKKYTFDTEMDLLASGPVIHTWEGIVKAVPTEIRFDRATGDFFFTGVWTNSWEAQQHLSHFEVHSDPVCWTLMGYASGWCTAFFGKPLLAIEPQCVGRGDKSCGWRIEPPAKWGPVAKPYLDALSPLFGV
ncbi:MAG: XylR N-terminal domain-containing protein [Deltaproteobacteria bacterium]|nr:XylR N-terminal domain-containing protein [Deltaproteobacteria bacterium]